MWNNKMYEFTQSLNQIALGSEIHNTIEWIREKDGKITPEDVWRINREFSEIPLSETLPEDQEKKANVFADDWNQAQSALKETQELHIRNKAKNMRILVKAFEKEGFSREEAIQFALRGYESLDITVSN